MSQDLSLQKIKSKKKKRTHQKDRKGENEGEESYETYRKQIPKRQ